MGKRTPMGATLPTLPSLRAVFETLGLRAILSVTLGIGVILYLGGYLVAVSGGFGPAYLASLSVYVVLCGTLGGVGVLLWGGRYHLEVWGAVRRCFDVSDHQYAATIDPLLDRAYDPKLIAAEFLIAFSGGVLADLLVGVPYAIAIETPRECVVAVAGGCVDYLSVINFLYGVVFLVVVITGLHAIVHFLKLIDRVTDLPVAEVETAAERLEPLAQFSIFVAVSLLVGVFLLSLVYARLLPAFESTTVPPYVFVVTVVIAVLLVVGVAVFWLPQMAIHGLITAAKQDAVADINQEYDRLLARCRAEEGTPARLSTELEILEARRRNAMEINTWSYNLPSLLPFIGSAAASSITWFVGIVQALPL